MICRRQASFGMAKQRSMSMELLMFMSMLCVDSFQRTNNGEKIGGGGDSGLRD